MSRTRDPTAAAGLQAMGARTFVALLLALGILAATPAAAGAHASFVTSSPEPGADLAAAPSEVTLRFTEPLIEDLSTVTVTDPTGRIFESGPTGEREITVDLTTTVQGEYLVEWKTVSPVDGHTLHGRFEFGVGSDVGEQATPSDAPSGRDLLLAAGRTVEYAGLLGVLGVLTLAALAGAARLEWAPRRLHRWVAVAAVGGVVTVAGELLLASTTSLAASMRAFLLAPSGLPRIGRLVTELAAVVLTWRAARRSGGEVASRRSRVGTTLLTLASLGLLAAAGHAAAGGPYGVMAATGHLWAVGVWAGALLVMAIQRPPEGWRGETGRRLLVEFSPIALTAFVATVLLGVVRGIQELAHPADLWTTAYGQVLWAKILAVAAMVPASLLAWRRRRARPRLEGGLALGVALAAAILAAFPVPPGRAGDEAVEQTGRATQGLPQPGDLTLAGEAGDTLVGLSVRPGEPGINDLFVHLVPIDGADEAGSLEVRLAVDGGQATTMRRCGTACRTATVPLQGGERLRFQIPAQAGGPAILTLPTLPAPGGGALARRLTDRMKQLEALRYDEVFGPVDPPIRSTWEIVAPDRLHGVTRRGDGDYSEIIRIDERRWTRRSSQASWEMTDGGPSVQANRFIWDYDNKVAARILGTAVLDGVHTRIVSFYVDVVGTAIWYRLWVDEDDRVRRAEMRAQGHFMDRRYYDFNAPVTIEAPN